MSEPSKPSDDKPADDTTANSKKAKDEEVDEGYTCSKCWYGYCACVVWTCKCVYNSILAVKNGIVCCLAAIWYPMKERCCSCCDNCDRKMNPYKDPYHNPYDTI